MTACCHRLENSPPSAPSLTSLPAGNPRRYDSSQKQPPPLTDFKFFVINCGPLTYERVEDVAHT